MEIGADLLGNSGRLVVLVNVKVADKHAIRGIDGVVDAALITIVVLLRGNIQQVVGAEPSRRGRNAIRRGEVREQIFRHGANAASGNLIVQEGSLR